MTGQRDTQSQTTTLHSTALHCTLRFFQGKTNQKILLYISDQPVKDGFNGSMINKYSTMTTCALIIETTGWVQTLNLGDEVQMKLIIYSTNLSGTVPFPDHIFSLRLFCLYLYTMCCGQPYFRSGVPYKQNCYGFNSFTLFRVLFCACYNVCFYGLRWNRFGNEFDLLSALVTANRGSCKPCISVGYT